MINQQYDGLMGIRFDDKTGTYQLDVSWSLLKKFTENKTEVCLTEMSGWHWQKKNLPKPIRSGRKTKHNGLIQTIMILKSN